MAVSFILKNATLKRTSVEANIHFRGKRYKKLTGATVIVAAWNKRTQRCRIIPAEPFAEAINEKIDHWDKAAKETLRIFTAKEGATEQHEFWEIFNHILNGTVKTIPSFTEYLSAYLDKTEAGKQKSTVLRYKKTLQLLCEFESQYYNDKLKFNDININYLFCCLRAYLPERSFAASALRM